MAHIFISTVVSAPIDQLWRKVRDFNAFPEWVPGILGSVIEDDKQADAVGCIRDLSVPAGDVRETLLALSDIDWSFTYDIISAPFYIENFVATLKLTPITDTNATFVQWSATFDCHKADEQEMIRNIGENVFKKGLDNLKAQFVR